MGRLEELRINAYLSEVARGYSNNAFVAQHLFPEITSEKEKIDIFEFNKEAFNLTIPNVLSERIQMLSRRKVSKNIQLPSLNTICHTRLIIVKNRRQKKLNCNFTQLML